MGKTTLAKLIFEDKRVVEKFHLRSWACVSDGIFNAERVLKDLCTYAGGGEYNEDLAVLQKKIGELVMGKKFLFVLDDVWTDRDKDWEDLKSPFNSCGVGSIFLVKGVLDMMHSRVTHSLGPLANAHCWELFSEKAFTHKNRKENLEQIGRDIVNKCKGVPLSAKVLGRVLCNQVDERKWKNVLESNYWDLPEEEDEDLAAMRISYYYLPFHLKLCFEYLSLFPSDWDFDKKYLVHLWIGEGFIKPERGRILEDIGSEYYEELQERSLIEANDIMHDLAHSLACKLSKKFNSRFMNGSIVDKPVVTSGRHVSFFGGPALSVRLAVRELHTCIYLVDYDSSLDASILCEIPQMKLLHVLDLFGIAMGNMSDDFFSELRHLNYLRLDHERIKKLPLSIYRLRSLQTLILAYCNLVGLSEEVVNLVSLLHLNLTGTQVSSLPVSLCNLPRLQTLILNQCRELKELPTEIGKLQTLRELRLRGTNILLLPDSVCNIANLETLDFSVENLLPKFIGRLTQLKLMAVYKVGIEEGRGIGELQNLRNLESLSLDCLENVKSVKEAKMAALENKKSLIVLSFAWSEGTSTKEEENEDHGESDSEVLEALQPHPTKIESMEFKGYNGKKFPSWMRGSHFFSLTLLSMFGMKRLTTVADATFKSLKNLYIKDCPNLEVFLIAAPMLEELSVESCSKIRCLSLDFCDGALPRGLEVNNCENLRLLYVRGCHQIEPMGNKGLPKSLETLRFIDCENLTSLLSSSSHNLASVASLDIGIMKCRRFESFGEQGLLYTLYALKLSHCESLRSLPRSMQSLHSLQIINCPQICLADDWLPMSINSLHVNRCPGLKSFPSYMDQLNSLNYLHIEGCPQLESFPDQGLPCTIRVLKLRDCENLGSLPSGLSDLKGIRRLEISGCHKLQIKAEDRLPKFDKDTNVYIDHPQLKLQLPRANS